MTVSNLGVCFGPTLLRPEEETVASILDLKFYNIVVEILIDNYQRIFFSEPDTLSPKLTNSMTVNESKTSNNSVIYSTPNNHIPAFPSSEERVYANNGQAAKIATNYRGYAQPYTCVSTKQNKTFVENNRFQSCYIANLLISCLKRGRTN